MRDAVFKHLANSEPDDLPWVVSLMDGHRYYISHFDYIDVPEGGMYVLFYTNNDRLLQVDVADISCMERST